MDFIQKQISKGCLYIMYINFKNENPNIDFIKIQILKMLECHIQVADTTFKFNVFKTKLHIEFNEINKLYPSIEWITEISNICGSSIQFDLIENCVKLNSNNVESFLEKMTLKTEECNDLFCLYLLYYILEIIN
jgi:hypothetical protein